MTPRDISIVIPTLNEADSIPGCLRSAHDAGAVQTIVVDGGSTDATRDLAIDAGASEVIRSIHGRGIQLNSGSVFARGEFVLFLHADNRMTPEMLGQICDAVNRDATVVWGAFRQRIDHTAMAYRWLEWGNAMRVRYRGLPFGDQAIFVRRDVFKRVGGFSETPLMEDVALSKKLRAERWPVLLDGPLVVSPRRWQTRGILRQTLRNQFIQISYAFGVSPERLAKWYR